MSEWYLWLPLSVLPLQSVVHTTYMGFFLLFSYKVILFEILFNILCLIKWQNFENRQCHCVWLHIRIFNSQCHSTSLILNKCECSVTRHHSLLKNQKVPADCWLTEQCRWFFCGSPTGVIQRSIVLKKARAVPTQNFAM